MNSNEQQELERLFGSHPCIKATLEPVDSATRIQTQRKLNQSLGIENPYLGMSFSELKALGHGLRG